MSSPLFPPIEMWGGVECTLNRVGDTYFDQLERNGHLYRPNDLDRFAELGIRVLRYPVQWERTAPEGIECANWSWADERLNRLRALGISPIAGLTHHGSGPRQTSLIEPSFAEGLAEFAAAVAQRYPWIEYYTPVNEPLTTARFSGLYGFWYPHGRDRRTFVRALLTECRAIILSMQAIRRINPAAQLIQTEDLGKTFSTSLLTEQANWENERRWLSFDLLCGCLDRDHVMWNFMINAGAGEVELEWFLEHACPPDVLGIDYYLTSERFLDEQLDRYPVAYHGGHGGQRYADVEAIRVDAGDALPQGHYLRMREAWERYQLPIAITEAHLCCTREEQMRWLVEAWTAGQALQQEGAQVRAITAWSLLGAFDWNNLVTRKTEFYEPGVFDVRGGDARPTALAGVVKALASGKQPDHPVLAQPGWWKRPDRFLYRSYPKGVASFPLLNQEDRSEKQGQPVLIIADAEKMGHAVARCCAERGLRYQLMFLAKIDMGVASSIATMLDDVHPWAVLALTGSEYMGSRSTTRADEPQAAQHVLDMALLAKECAQRSIGLVAFSSDLVFAGTHQAPYTESDPARPRSTAGRLQLEMETLVLFHHPSTLLIRTGPLFSPWEDFDMGRAVHAARRHAGSAMSTTIISPTYVPDLIHACLDLLIDGEHGHWHLANRGALSWTDFIQRVVDADGLDSVTSTENVPSVQDLASPFCISYALGSERGQLLPSFDDALTRYRQERRRGRRREDVKEPTEQKAG